MKALLLPIHYWQAGGPLLIPIAFTCAGIWAYFLRTRRAFLDDLRIPEDLDDTLARGLADTSPARIKHQLASWNGTLCAAAAHALHAFEEGSNPGKAFDRCQALRLEHLNRDIVVLAALTAVAPLLGLLGTVMGMVETFQAVSFATGVTTDRVASGISSALITTQFGLIVAIPGVFGLALLSRIRKQLNMQFAICKTHLLLGLKRRTRS